MSKPSIRTLKLFFRSSPCRVSCIFLLTVISGILPSLRILISIKLINLIANLLQTPEQIDYTRIFSLLSIWAVVTLVSELAAKIQSTLSTIVTEKFSALIITMLSEKLTAITDLSFFENRENLAKIEMVKEQIQVRPQNYVFNIMLNLQKIINLAGMLFVLFSVDYLLPVLMICSTLPVFLISQSSGKKQWSKTEKLQNNKLKLATYIKHSIEGEKAKDNFLFAFTENFKTSYIKIRDEYLKNFIGIARGGLFFQLIASLVSALIMIALFFAMIFVVVKKQIAVGAVAGYVQAFMYSQYEIQDLAMYGRWYFTLIGYFKNFFYIIDWEKEGSSKSFSKNSTTVSTKEASDKIILTEKINSIELKDIWFSYTEDENNFVIKGLSLFIDGNKSYAIVGKNGSGKTTLVKLLTGFYTPQKGSIIINGKYKLSDLDAKAYRARLSAVFQDFAIYSGYTIDENIFVKPEHSQNEEAEKLNRIKFLGSDFENRLADNYSSVLGMQYGGVELSGGQRQRLASLRSFLKKSEVIFFDEPTSAIDPIAENEFIESIFTQTKGKISLIVTHRMGSVKLCNEIIVVDLGQIAESGTFDSLIEKDGLFAKLYNSQKQNFES